MENRKILVVEDETIIAMDIQHTLKSFGYDVCGVVVSGEESVEKASIMNPDIILMDIKLKGSIDGLSAAKRIQSISNIPVIYLTSYGEETILKELDRTKPFSYINKPFEDRELQACIERILNNTHKSQFN